MKTAIAYIRVSTQQQGKSGLGIEAQTAAVNAWAAAEGYTIIDTVIEVETGKGSDALRTRPKLATVIEIARLTGAVIAVAKLDRLTRNVAFGAALLNRTDLTFKSVDMPHANNFMLHITLCVAEQEREMISKRTKDALQAAKDRGVKLGSPNSCANQAARSVAFAEGLRAIVEPISHLPSRQIAALLNAQGALTPTGGAWQSTTVLRLINRLELAA